MNIAVVIVGIDGWERYTLPLIESIQKHDPRCNIRVVDNASESPYPPLQGIMVRSNRRMCYSAAINLGKRVLNDHKGPFDWYIVLSNDVLCTDQFAHLLEPLAPCVAGPQLWHEHGLSWIVGWCVCIPRAVWDAVGGWDEKFLVSSVEDVDFSTCAIEKGYPLLHMPELPFVHLDQRQRFTLIPNYWESEAHNWAHFRTKHSKVRA